jgi:peptidoglycan/LPS O-acetylase OafA/YrhL
MNTRTKLIVSVYAMSAMMLLNAFSKPLHIPEVFQWVLIIGVFLPIGLMFHYNKRFKEERDREFGSQIPTTTKSLDARSQIKRRLVLMMVSGGVIGLCAPIWLPLTGTTSGPGGDFLIGLIAAAVVCTIFGIRIARLPKQLSPPTPAIQTPTAPEKNP